MFVKYIYLAKDGKEAFELFKNNSIDVVITDLRMPNMNGVELIKAIRQINQEVKIIVISAYKEDLPQEQANMVSAVFEKPINFIKLVNELDVCVQDLSK
jgi:CheY-like chemotaxis protein